MMKRLTIILVVLAIAGFAVVLPARASNTSPAIVWQKSLGGYYSDEAYSVAQTSDGGYIVAGYSESDDGNVTGHHGNTDMRDIWVVKLDTKGNLNWQKSLGGSDWDGAHSVAQTSDGGYIVAGYSSSNDGNVTGHHGSTDSNDVWVVKLDAKGNLSWQKSLGGTKGDGASSIILTSDGGYIVAGSSSSKDGDVTGNHGDDDYWIIKLDAKGNLSWQKSLGGTMGDGASSIAQTSDGGYIVAGYSNSTDGDVTGHHGDFDYWIVKLDTKGNLSWQKSFGGSKEDIAHSIVQTSDGGYIVAGTSLSNDGDVTGHHGKNSCTNDVWVVKLDAKGNLLWQKSLGGSESDNAYSVAQTSDGGYIVAGYSTSTDGDVTGHHGVSERSDFWVVKLDAKGNLSWQKSLGGFLGDDDAHSIVQTSDGGYIVAGSTFSTDGDVIGGRGINYDFWVVKLSEALFVPTSYPTTAPIYSSNFQMQCTYPPCPGQVYCPECSTCAGGCGLVCPNNYTLTRTVTPSTKPTGTQKSPLSYASAGALLGAGLLLMKRRE